MSWWLWILCGLILLALELFVPSGFFLCIVGLAAIVTGLMVLIGILGAAWVQWIFCAALAVVLVLYVRQYLLGIHVSGAPSANQHTGQIVVAMSDLEPGQEGRGEMRGVGWTIVNAGTGLIRSGERCVVEAIDGVTLRVRSTQG